MTDALAVHYAEALALSVMAKNSSLAPEAAKEQLDRACALINASHDLQMVLYSPAVPRQKKAAVVGQLLDDLGLDRVIRNFLMVVVEHRRIAELGRIREAFEKAVDEHQGFVRAEIVSAFELTDPQKEAILHSLGTAAGKFIRPVYSVDKNLVGGVIARLGSKEFDGSLIGRLDALRRKLSPQN